MPAPSSRICDRCRASAEKGVRIVPRGLKNALFKPGLGYFGSVVATGNYIQTAVSTLINASVLNNADVDVCQPGSPGLLTIVADYTQTPGGVLVIEIGGVNPGTDF